MADRVSLSRQLAPYSFRMGCPALCQADGRVIHAGRMGLSIVLWKSVAGSVTPDAFIEKADRNKKFPRWTGPQTYRGTNAQYHWPVVYAFTSSLASGILQFP
jgi:hypothetical protein